MYIYMWNMLYWSIIYDIALSNILLYISYHITLFLFRGILLDHIIASY